MSRLRLIEYHSTQCKIFGIKCERNNKLYFWTVETLWWFPLPQHVLVNVFHGKSSWYLWFDEECYFRSKKCPWIWFIKQYPRPLSSFNACFQLAETGVNRSFICKKVLFVFTSSSAQKRRIYQCIIRNNSAPPSRTKEIYRTTFEFECIPQI